MTRPTEEWLRAHQRKGSSAVELRAYNPTAAGSIPAPSTKGNMRRRKPPNKMEAAFGEYLRICEQHGGHKVIGFETITLRMPGGTRYTPDWAVYEWGSWEEPEQLCLYEVKGHMREAARVRLKEFAAHFTMFKFYLVRATDRRLLTWSITQV